MMKSSGATKENEKRGKIYKHEGIGRYATTSALPSLKVAKTPTHASM
jgi:hypothetical protein